MSTRPGNKEGGGHPMASQAALHSSTQQSPPFALHDTTEPCSRFVPAKGRASLSHSVPFVGLSQQRPSTQSPPPQGGGSVVGIAVRRKQDVSVSSYPTPMKGTHTGVFTTPTFILHPTNTWGRAAGGRRDPPSKIMPLKETMPGNELGERDETPICCLWGSARTCKEKQVQDV